MVLSKEVVQLFMKHDILKSGETILRHDWMTAVERFPARGDMKAAHTNVHRHI